MGGVGQERGKVKEQTQERNRYRKSRCRKWMALPVGARQSIPHCADEPGSLPRENSPPTPPPVTLGRVSLTQAQPPAGSLAHIPAICSLGGTGLCLAYQATVPFEEHSFEEIAPVVTHGEGAIKH